MYTYSHSSALLSSVSRARILSLGVLAGGAAVGFPQQSTAAILPIPANIASGSTVNLQCGTTYQGTLELNGKTNVTVQTIGNCGKAGISPGRAITGWTRQSGNIYSAPISFTPVQVAIGGEAISAAHWPNQPWATSTAGLPSSDLAGANLVVLVNQSVVQSQTLTGNSISTSQRFYVEGKLWMLDSPGEWAVQNGRLYMWAPDGQSPEGRAWAAPNGNGVNADKSNGIVIDGVSIFSATDGISGNSSTNLKVLNTDITNSYRDGIWASGSRGLQVSGTKVSNSRRNGIDGWYSITGAVITDSSISNTGMVGMPTASDGGIMFGDGSDNRIDNVRVTNSAYHGINVIHNRMSFVLNSVVDTACARLTDCAAIYTSARDQQPLTMLIEGNTVTNIKGPDVIGIYLDDHANGVTINRNTVTNNQRGLVIHDGFNNVVTNNTFAASAVLHIGLSQSAGNIHDIRITDNTFRSTNGEQTFNLEAGNNYRQFATFDYNTYISNNWNIFGHTWDGRSSGIATSYQGWKNQMQQDAHSVTVNAVADGQGKGSLTAP